MEGRTLKNDILLLSFAIFFSKSLVTECDSLKSPLFVLAISQCSLVVFNIA